MVEPNKVTLSGNTIPKRRIESYCIIKYHSREVHLPKQPQQDLVYKHTHTQESLPSTKPTWNPNVPLNIGLYIYIHILLEGDGAPQIRGRFGRVLGMRLIVDLGLLWSPHIHGNCHVANMGFHVMLGEGRSLTGCC